MLEKKKREGNRECLFPVSSPWLLILQNKLNPKILRYKITILLSPQILGFRHLGRAPRDRLDATSSLASAGGDLTAGVWSILRCLCSHVWKLRPAISGNSHARPLLWPPSRGQLRLSNSVVTAFQEQASQERKAEAQDIFMVSPQRSHSVTSVLLCWLRQSQRSAQVQEEGIQMPPPHSVGEVKVL